MNVLFNLKMFELQIYTCTTYNLQRTLFLQMRYKSNFLWVKLGENHGVPHNWIWELLFSHYLVQ